MEQKTINRILIANRGEIAVRIIRACRDLGISPLVVYSDPDRSSLHVQLAEEAFPLGGSTAAESYLDQAKILDAARGSRADAIHPGYGFLSENPIFAERVERAGMTFIGPTPQAIRLLGDKTAARKLARDLGIPTIPGTFEPLKDDDDAVQTAVRIGYPVLLKAAAGGGGKGMRIVHAKAEMSAALRAARSEAAGAFGDDRVYLEKYIHAPRHIEIQILADAHGSVVHLGERECSIQRRHQKVIEESPSTVVDSDLRQRMGEAAVALARSAGYTNAGTMEFIVDDKKRFYFLEVNTRLQVEHPVTELVCSIDLVKEQIRIAEGKTLTIAQKDVQQTGHALECRIYAEDPENAFFPSTGVLEQFDVPQGPQVRVENGFRTGDVVGLYYDPLLSKLVCWGKNREESVRTMRRALSEFTVRGIKTTIPFCKFVVNHPEFMAGKFDTHFVERCFDPKTAFRSDKSEELAAILAAVLIFSSGAVESPNHNHRSTAESKWKKTRSDAFRS
ncbi:MAG: acetyl-CoA carboxylase biotin carboxylase subunit [Bacteroidota bacterium]